MNLFQLMYAPDTGVVEGATEAPENPEVNDAPAADTPPADNPVESGGDLLEDPVSKADANWLDAIPEEYRENPNITKYGNMAEFMKGHENALAMIGKKGLERPAEDASEAVKAEYYKRIGRPDSPNDYEWEDSSDDPELKIELDQDAFAGVKKRAHEMGLTNEQFKGMVDLYAADMRERMGVEQQNEVVRQNEAKVELQKDWGVKYEANLKEANEAIRRFGMVEELQDLGLGNSAKAIKMFHNLLEMVGEDKIIGDKTSTGGSFEEQRISIRDSEAYKNPAHKDHKKAVKNYQSLYERRYG